MNPHRPALSGYRTLFQQWSEMGKPFPLAADQVAKLLDRA